MSSWADEKAERNRRSIARLTRTLPAIFPAAVLHRALNRPFVPPTPRLAVDSYWRAHPVRADRLARALATRSGAPSGWSWRLDTDRGDGLPGTFRIPPAPYRERAYAKGPGFCCVVSRFTAFRGMWIFGMQDPTKKQAGTPPVWSRGNSGMRRTSKQHFCGDCRRAAAHRAADDSGSRPKSITASRCFRSGPNTGPRPGRSCCDIGACPIFS